MIFGMTALTFVHVLLSLVGIGSGFVVLAGLLTAKRFDGWTLLFLATTAATSVTGFFFPIERFTPGHALGILSLLALALAILGRYAFHLAGRWGPVYAASSVFALYLNFFVLIVQLFQKVPVLHEVAPTQAELPFLLTQSFFLAVFLVAGIAATLRVHGEPVRR